MSKSNRNDARYYHGAALKAVQNNAPARIGRLSPADCDRLAARVGKAVPVKRSDLIARIEAASTHIPNDNPRTRRPHFNALAAAMLAVAK